MQIMFAFLPFRYTQPKTGHAYDSLRHVQKAADAEQAGSDCRCSNSVKKLCNRQVTLDVHQK